MEEEEKILRLSFVQEKINTIADFQTQIVGRKRKLLGKDQWQPAILGQAIHFSGCHSFQWNPFYLAILFSNSHFLMQKPFLLVKVVHFSRCLFQQKPFLVVEAIIFMKESCFNGNYSFWLTRFFLWKPSYSSFCTWFF